MPPENALLDASERGAGRRTAHCGAQYNPRRGLETEFELRGERHAAPTQLQTVLLEPDDNRLRLTFHAQFVCDKLALEVRRIELRLQSLELAVPGSR